MKSYTRFRAALYGVPLFLTPFADELVPILRQDVWPTPMKCVACSILGVIAMCIGLRAYYDGSFQRQKDAGAGQSPTAPPPATPVKESKP